MGIYGLFDPQESHPRTPAKYQYHGYTAHRVCFPHPSKIVPREHFAIKKRPTLQTARTFLSSFGLKFLSLAYRPFGLQDLTAQFCVREIFMESLVKSGWLIRIRISWFIMIPIKLGSINPLCHLNNQVFFSLLMWICCEDLASDWTTWQLKLPFLDGERSQLFCGKLWLTDFFGPWLET